MNTELQNKLSQPFEDKDIEWRLQWTNDDKTSGRAVPYVTNRAIQARLDSVLASEAGRTSTYRGTATEKSSRRSAVYPSTSRTKRSGLPSMTALRIRISSPLRADCPTV